MAQPIFCHVCNIGVSSEPSMRDHVRGRRHQQAVAAVERRTTQAKNSLYCHGFPPDMPHAILHGYFERFGPVVRIMIETIKGCYCIVQYDSRAPVDMVLSQRTHLLCGSKLTVRPRKPITKQRGRQDQERSPQKVSSSQEEDEVEATHETMMKNLMQQDSVSGQMDALYETMHLSDAEMERRNSVCQYLHNILVAFLPTSTIHQFGSSVNGLGMRGCDMDIFLDIHDNETSLQWEESLKHRLKPVTLPYIREIQVLKTTEGPLMPSQLRPLSLVHRVKLVSRILMVHAHHCSHITFVPSLRCPIVRLVHTPSGIKCDLSINNRLALRNTQLLKMCAADRRVRLLVFAVRYWGRWKQVAGNQNCGPRLSNYCLSLLVIFYLHHTRPPLLPSVQALADLAGAHQKCTLEEWDCSLPDAVPDTDNTQSADELLQGFFEFYHKTSLSSSVFLTRAGTVSSLSDFLREKDSEPHLADFKVKAMAVQDPFVLCHNIAQNINDSARNKLVKEIAIAAAKSREWGSTSPEREPSSEESPPPLWGLPLLFSAQGAPQDLALADTPPGDSSWCEAMSPRPTASTAQPHFTCCLALDRSALSQSVLAALSAKGDYRAAWFRRIRTLLLWSLRDVFLFTLKTDAGGEPFSFESLDVDEIPGNCAQDSVMDSSVAGASSPETDPALGDGPSEGGQSSEAGCAQDAVPSDGKREVSHRQKLSRGEFLEQGGRCGPCSKQRRSVVVDSSDACVEAGPLPMAVDPSSSPSPNPTDGKAELSSPQTSAQVDLEASAVSEPSLSSVCCGSENRTVDDDVEMTSIPDLPDPGRCVDARPSVPQGDDGTGAQQCSVGRTARKASAVPLRVECSPIGGGETLISVAKLSPDHTPHSEGPSSAASPGHPATVDMPEADSPEVSPGNKAPSSSAQQVTEVASTSQASELPSATSQGVSLATVTKKCRQLHLFCEGSCRAWYGRKGVRTSLLSEGHQDDLELEKVISMKIADRDNGSSLPALQFHCTLTPVPKADSAEAEVRFEPAKPVPKEFSVFNTFFKSFFTKLVAKNLLETATV